jgi:heme exporter protein B
MRQGGGAGMALGFFLVVVVMLPLGLGPDSAMLTRIAPGALWVALLLSVLLSTDRIFQADYEDGALEVMLLGPVPTELIVIAKTTAHWLTSGLPLALAAPLLGIFLNLPAEAFAPVVATTLIGSPALSFLGAVGAAITVGVRRGGLLLSILVLPLYVPVLIFGVSAAGAAITGPVPFGTPALILAALSLASIVLCPLAAAAALRVHFR